ncbi:MAG TPA: serine/threonine-protein kinase [Steroidobacteraceae bacterium]|nr:serine/threonine-protein kinase [Steroidobacteraceae bacterium]
MTSPARSAAAAARPQEATAPQLLILLEDPTLRGWLSQQIGGRWECVIETAAPARALVMRNADRLRRYRLCLVEWQFASSVLSLPNLPQALSPERVCNDWAILANDDAAARDAEWAGFRHVIALNDLSRTGLFEKLSVPLAGLTENEQAKPDEWVTDLKGYSPVQVLGRGEFGTVYLAESPRILQPVALKVMHRAEGDERSRISLLKFAQEYRIAQAISDPAVVDVFDYGSTDRLAFIAMEYFSRGSLRPIAGTLLAPPVAGDWIRRIALALDAVHRHGVVHRDLKPANIMVRQDGSLALVDFGSAKYVDVNSTITISRQVRGTPFYMSPELATGENLDGRSDLYSLGVIAFELLTGEKPFSGQTVFEILEQHEKAAIPRLPERLAAWQPLIDTLLAKLPAGRPATAADVLPLIPEF